MDLEKRIELIRRKPTEELITERELRELLETNAHPKHYIGFEISGGVHLGGLTVALKVRDLMEAGVKPTIWLADYHAWINGKLGGDLELIRKVARGYFKQAFVSLGLEEEKVEYKLASEVYDNDYWKEVLNVAKNTTLQRMLRCVTIMGRKEGEATESTTVLYPAMQAADVFLLDVDIVHGGMDQRKIHVLAREIAQKMKRKVPVALHTHLLMGLQGPQKMGFEANEKADVEISSKMSKSNPLTCIYIHESEEEIKRKIGKAYCPEKEIENNPLIELCEYILMRNSSTELECASAPRDRLRDGKSTLKIERSAKFGGDVEYASVQELKSEYSLGKLHPLDLKSAVSKNLAKMLEPSRKYFQKHEEFLKVVEKA
ncbi:MAG: tyrosine--tRNA ligase [Candidatus Micrarchaeota archaeon]